MRLAQFLKRQLFAHKRPRVSSSDHRPSFVLESLEPRLLLSAAPVAPTEMPVTEPVATAAVVTTDKADYSPGETAVITTSNTDQEGAKFAEGEILQFQVTRTDGIEDFPMGNLPWYVTDGVGGFEAYQDYDATTGQAVDRNNDGQADWIRPDNDLTVNGSISTNWFVEDQYLGASLQLTATGQTSGAVATTQFTDSPRVGSVVVGSQSQQVTAGVAGTTQYTFNVFRGNNNNNTAGATVAITGLPSGVTVTGLTTSITLAATNNETTSAYAGMFSLNVPTGLAATSYTFNVVVTATQGSGGDNATGIGTLVVGQPAAASTTTTVSSSSSTSTYGNAVTFSANVTGNPSVGTVQFLIDGNAFGSAVAVSGGVATSGSISTLDAGNHVISAVYSGGAGYQGSTSANFTQTVNQKAVNYTIGDDSHVYGSTANLAADLPATFLTGVNGQNLSITYASVGNTTTSNVGTYAITGIVADGSGLASNYIVNLTNGTLTVNKATVNYTIGNATKVFGQTINLATALGSSFNTGVNGETLGITYSSDGVPNAALVGSHAITGTVNDGSGSGSLSNYNVTVINGTLTVTAPSVITAVQDGGNLIIVGTEGIDTIDVNANNPSAISINGKGSYLVSPTGHVIVYGLGSADNINLAGNVNLEAHGGAGNDTITGGAGNDVIWGDAGDDTLTGSAGNDVLAGGIGSDRLVGSAGHDMLIAGELTGDHNGAAYDYTTLRAIDDQWAANFTPDTDLANTSNDVDVVDESADQLTGSSGHDWFIVGSSDKITDINSVTKDNDKITSV